MCVAHTGPVSCAATRIAPSPRCTTATCSCTPPPCPQPPPHTPFLPPSRPRNGLSRKHLLRIPHGLGLSGVLSPPPPPGPCSVRFSDTCPQIGSGHATGSRGHRDTEVGVVSWMLVGGGIRQPPPLHISPSLLIIKYFRGGSLKLCKYPLPNPTSDLLIHLFSSVWICGCMCCSVGCHQPLYLSPRPSDAVPLSSFFCTFFLQIQTDIMGPSSSAAALPPGLCGRKPGPAACHRETRICQWGCCPHALEVDGLVQTRGCTCTQMHTLVSVSTCLSVSGC